MLQEGLKKKRIVGIDLLKAFAIFLVVWGHIIQFCLSSDYNTEPIIEFNCTFIMPLFIILSGFFFKNSSQKYFGGLVGKLFARLIVPSIIWCVVIYGLICFSHFLEGRKEEISITDFFLFVHHNYWFLKSLFCCYLIAYAGIHSKLPTAVWALSTVILVQFAPLFNLWIMYPCFLVGVYIREVINKDWFVQSYPIFLIVYLVSMLFHYLIPILRGVDHSSWDTLPILWIICLRSYQILLGVFPSMFLISLVKKLYWEENDKYQLGIGRFLAGIGKETLGIYLAHMLIVSYIFQKFVNFDTVNSLVFNIILSPLLTVLVIAFSMLIIRLLERNHITSRLFLGNRG